jgi:uncharacterized protein GlcG (DUF336 family)
MFRRTATVLVAMTLAVGGALADNKHEAGDGSDNNNGNNNGPGGNGCQALPDHDALKTALVAAVVAETSGLNMNMWATLVDRDGIVCSVAFSGATRGSQWPGSRVISAQKANTANAFSLDSSSSSNSSGKPNGLSLSTANLYSAVQSGGSLFGLQESNPVNHDAAYDFPSTDYGTDHDPMIGKKIGGVNVFGGGLAAYGAGKKILGGIGVSGDTSCADHMIAWRVRKALGLDHLSGVGGVSGDVARPDNIIYDIVANPDGTGGTGQNPAGSGGVGTSPSGFGHPKCGNTGDQTALDPVQP